MKPTLPRTKLAAAVGLFLALASAWTGCARRESAPETRTIDVPGRGTASAMPDKIEWRLLIHCDAPSVAAAHDHVLAAETALLARAKSLGVPDRDFKTKDLRQGANWKWVNGQREPTNTYYSEMSLVLSLPGVAKYPAVAEKLFVDNALVVEGVDFEISKPEALRLKALANAIADAKAKAEFAAGQFGIRLGDVSRVNLLNQQPIFVGARVMGALAERSSGASLPALQPVKVSASVMVTYEIK